MSRRASSRSRTVAFAALAAFLVVACAPRLPPKATLVDARRGGTSIAELEAGRSLVVRKCGNCHQTPMPSDHTAVEWLRALDEMSPRANVAGSQRAAIERYLVVMAGR